MFRTRLISGIVLVALALAVLLPGGIFLLLATAFLSLVGLRELYRAAGLSGTVLEVLGYLAAAGLYLALFFYGTRKGGEAWILRIGIALLLGLLLLYVLRYPRYALPQVVMGLFGYFYVAVLFAFLYLTRELPGGRFLVWLIVLCSWGADTSAYCVGRLIGKRPLSPVLSPKKSKEGAVGGVVGAAVLTAVYCTVFQRQMRLGPREIVLLTVCGALGALLSMCGDLAASGIKRHYLIKDYGKLIPGHGGVLDRFDSVLFTAPVIYYASLLSQRGIHL